MLKEKLIGKPLEKEDERISASKKCLYSLKGLLQKNSEHIDQKELEKILNSLYELSQEEKFLPSDHQILYMVIKKTIERKLVNNSKDENASSIELNNNLQQILVAIQKLMIISNQLLVKKIAAKQYSPFNQNPKILFEDLVSEGNIGLKIAFNRFDPNYGVKLTTYASPWIKQKIDRYIVNNKNEIRIPVHLDSKIGKIYQEIDNYKKLNGSIDLKAQMEIIKKNTGSDKEYYQMLETLERTYFSLDEKVGKEDNDSSNDFHSLLPNSMGSTENQALFTGEKGLKKIQKIVINILKKTESKRDIVVFLLYSDLFNDEEFTLSRLGEIFGLSWQRIEQINKLSKSELEKKIRGTNHSLAIDDCEPVQERYYEDLIFNYVTIPMELSEKFSKDELKIIYRFFYKEYQGKDSAKNSVFDKDLAKKLLTMETKNIDGEETNLFDVLENIKNKAEILENENEILDYLNVNLQKSKYKDPFLDFIYLRYLKKDKKQKTYLITQKLSKKYNLNVTNAQLTTMKRKAINLLERNKVMLKIDGNIIPADFYLKKEEDF